MKASLVILPALAVSFPVLAGGCGGNSSSGPQGGITATDGSAATTGATNGGFTSGSGSGTTTGGVTTSGSTSASSTTTTGSAVTTGTNGAAMTGSGTTAATDTSGTSTTGGMMGSGGVTGSGGAGTTAGGATTGGADSGMSEGCGTMPSIQSNQYNNGQHIAIMAAGMQREYILNVPANYDNTHPYRLIIAFHELNGNDDEMYRNDYYHLKPLSDDSTIFVAPNGQKNGGNCGDASGCGWPNSNGSDLALADAVVAELEQNFCIDTNRIFATGWSYGGSMSYKTACERPLGADSGYIRGIAVYSGAQLSGNCTPSESVAYYGSHGTHDSVLNYDGGVSLAQNFASANGCTWETPTKVTNGDHVCTDLMGCMTGYPVEFCSFNGDHTPDPRDGNQTSWEYQNVWDFFSQF